LAKFDVKGMNNRLVFLFSQGSAGELQGLLKDKLDSNPRLFQGSSIVFEGEALALLSGAEINALQRICLDYGMYFASPEPFVRETQAEKIRPAAGNHDLIVHKTLRSGQKVHSDGAVTIWGDVHESAEITSGGDILVLGKLEGFAHAGCYGNSKSFIFALNLCPRQLRIADRISRSSGKLDKPSYPEIAYVCDENICIKEYTSRDSLFR
jgi:septum site-determining protein MinC